MIEGSGFGPVPRTKGSGRPKKPYRSDRIRNTVQKIEWPVKFKYRLKNSSLDYQKQSYLAPIIYLRKNFNRFSLVLYCTELVYERSSDLEPDQELSESMVRIGRFFIVRIRIRRSHSGRNTTLPWRRGSREISCIRQKSRFWPLRKGPERKSVTLSLSVLLLHKWQKR